MLAGWFPAEGWAESLSLDASLARAAGNHPDVALARAEVEASQARERNTRSAYGPKLEGAANIQVWNDEIGFSFVEVGQTLPTPETPYEEFIYGFLNSANVTVRDQVTWDASLTLTQPLTPLWDVYLASHLRESSTRVARTQVSAAERGLERDVAVAFLRVNQARKGLETAESAVAQLQAQVKRLTDLVELGAAQSADRLRLEVAVAAAQQKAFQAQANLNMARAAFAVALGEDGGSDLDADVLEPGALPSAEARVESLIEEAMASREELKNLEDQRQQAELNVDLRRAGYKPDVVALAQFSHTAGQGLAGSDTFFVGASARWKIFEWGATSSQVDEASANVVKVAAAREQARRQIALQVRKAWYDYEASRQGFAVAAAAVTGAEESFRVENERFSAGRSTPTDLLAAQTALVEARNNRDAAYYQGLVHRAELLWAVGARVTAKNLIEGIQ